MSLIFRTGVDLPSPQWKLFWLQVAIDFRHIRKYENLCICILYSECLKMLIFPGSFSGILPVYCFWTYLFCLCLYFNIGVHLAIASYVGITCKWKFETWKCLWIDSKYSGRRQCAWRINPENSMRPSRIMTLCTYLWKLHQ